MSTQRSASEQEVTIGKYTVSWIPDVQWAVVAIPAKGRNLSVTPVYEEDGPDAFENCKRWAEAQGEQRP